MGSLSLMEASADVSETRAGTERPRPTSALDDGRDNLVVAGPDKLSRGVHGHSRLLATQLYDDSAIVETNCDTLLALLVGDTPGALQAVVQ